MSAEWRVILGRVERFAAHYRGPRFHAMLTDPPYHLGTITKRFGNASELGRGGRGAFGRHAVGFLGARWDAGDLSFRPEIWRALRECLLPGAFGAAFAASRNWHRVAVAIEDAGFIIHPSIFGWLRATGFPKAKRIRDSNFSGHGYGLQVLKPSLEPILVFQNPPTSRAAVQDILATGAGALNVDAARIVGPEAGGGWGGRMIADTTALFGPRTRAYRSRAIRVADDAVARWPGNFVAAHLPSCRRAEGRWQRADGCPAQALRDEVGDRAAAYWLVADWALEVAEALDRAQGLCYAPRPSPEERDAGVSTARTDPLGRRRANTHPAVKPLAVCRWLASLLLPPPTYAPRRIFIPFAGSGSEAIGAALAGWEQVVAVEADRDFALLARQRLAWWSSLGVQIALPI